MTSSVQFPVAVCVCNLSDTSSHVLLALPVVQYALGLAPVLNLAGIGQPLPLLSRVYQR